MQINKHGHIQTAVNEDCISSRRLLKLL